LSSFTENRNLTLLPLINTITSIKYIISSVYGRFLAPYIESCEDLSHSALESEKFPSNNLIRCIQWHPNCRRIISVESSNNESNYYPIGKPRVAIVFNSNIVEIHHTGDHILSTNDNNISPTQQPPAITLRHKLHEDLTCCAWPPYSFSSIAVLSAKNGVLYWQNVGRQDVKSVATISSINFRGKSEKLVPSSNALHIWSPPNWFKKDIKDKTRDLSLENKTAICWLPNGETLLVLWYNHIFTVGVSKFSELSNSCNSTCIAKISNLRSPLTYNIAQNTGLFSACNYKGTSVILDKNKKWKFFSNWNETLVVSKYGVKNDLKIENGVWWENSKISSRNKPLQTFEGMYLFHYTNGTELYVIQIFKNSVQNDKNSDPWVDECKQVFDLKNTIISDDTGYYAAADEDDTLVQFRYNFVITAIAWRDDICVIGHGDGQITILKARINIGGIIFQYIKTLDLTDSWSGIDSKIVDITIFENRWCSLTTESGEFEYCKIGDI